jgi:hypothetical protein
MNVQIKRVYESAEPGSHDRPAEADRAQEDNLPFCGEGTGA